MNYSSKFRTSPEIAARVNTITLALVVGWLFTLPACGATVPCETQAGTPKATKQPAGARRKPPSPGNDQAGANCPIGARAAQLPNDGTIWNAIPGAVLCATYDDDKRLFIAPGAGVLRRTNHKVVRLAAWTAQSKVLEWDSHQIELARTRTADAKPWDWLVVSVGAIRVPSVTAGSIAGQVPSSWDKAIAKQRCTFDVPLVETSFESDTQVVWSE